ncbi:hypothetical protein ACFL49_00155 [Candidatus Omnitrophota bacterium]
MNNKIIGILFIVLLFCGCDSRPDLGGSNGNVLDHGDNHVELRRKRRVDDYYRVFGITVERYKNDPFNHISAFMQALPLDRADKIFDQDNCERRALQGASLIPIITMDDSVLNDLEYFSDQIERTDGHRFALEIIGSWVEVVEHTFEGEEMHFTGGPSLKKCLLIEEVYELE